jgi:sigma-B regulation protein RsbU (phosphoserine phosphatase)
VTERPDASPAEALAVVNAVLYDNIRRRLFQYEHVTLTLLRYFPDGRVVFAGAHEEIVVWRAATGRCERIATPGTWLGAAFDIARHTVASHLRLEPGDLLVLYTDGLIQGESCTGEAWGMSRLCAAVERASAGEPATVVQAVLDEQQRFAATRDDDVTLLVARYVGA